MAPDGVQGGLEVAGLGAGHGGGVAGCCGGCSCSCCCCSAAGIPKHPAEISPVLGVAPASIAGGRDAIHFKRKCQNGSIFCQVIVHETSAVRLPTLVQVRSHTCPDVEDAVVVVGAVVVAGEEVPHHPS